MIEWIRGESCPVLPDTEVRVVRRDGTTEKQVASQVEWLDYGDHPLDVTAYEVIAGGEFTKWNGGKCPVDSRVFVELRLRGYAAIFAPCHIEVASDVRWTHVKNLTDVVEFRPVPAPGTPISPAEIAEATEFMHDKLNVQPMGPPPTMPRPPAVLWDGESPIGIGLTVKQGYVIGQNGSWAWVEKDGVPHTYKVEELEPVKSKYQKAAEHVCAVGNGPESREIASVLQALENSGIIKLL